MIRIALAFVCAAALLGGPALAQEAAVTRRALEVRDTPGDAGRSVATLPAQAPVTRTNERQGPWVQVRTASGATGWVHLFDVGPASSAPAESSIGGSALRGVTSLFGGSRPSTQTGSTAGIRGLGAEDLAQAQPNPQALRQMEGLRQNDADVRAFAGRSAWRPAAVDPLPEPARAVAQPSNVAPGGQVAP